VRLFHWSAAETSAIENAYRSASQRHGERHWPELLWYDLLVKVMQAEPVVVRGAHGFGLKAVANAMFRHDLISTQWAEGLADGAGVMAGAWHAAQEAALRGIALTEMPAMREIERYNEIDCRVMAEVLDHLRREH
jgi:predicted RecB family nuclease